MPSGLTRYVTGANTGTATATGINGLAQGRFVGVTAAGAPTSGTFAAADFVVDQNGQMYICTVAGTPGTWTLPGNFGNLLTVGEETISRDLATGSSGTAATGVLKLTYFTARKTETTTQVRVITGGVAAAATPTICRIGLYTIDASLAGALVASTTNDTTLFSSTNTAYTKSWTSSYAKLSGQRYALATIVVSAAATPNWTGEATVASTAARAENAIDPRVNGILTAQSDLPSSFTNASLSNIVDSRSYAVILP
jgi:hypothetical protein